MIGDVLIIWFLKWVRFFPTPWEGAPGLIPIAYARRNHGFEKGTLTPLAERH